MFGIRKKTKYREESYDFDSEEENQGTSLADPVHYALNDYITALLLGVVGVVFICLTTFPALHPTAWAACAEAAGLREPVAIIPGLWRLFAHILYNIAGIQAGTGILAFLGKISFGVILALSYLFCRGVLAFSVRSQTPEYKFWRRYVSRLICLLVAFLFAASDPVWQLCLSFTPQTFLLVLMLFAAYQWIKFFTDGSVRPAYISMFCFGLLAADTPLGIVLTVCCWVGYMILVSQRLLGHVDLLDAYKRQAAKWYLTFFWALGVVVGIAFNVMSFISFDGLAATGLTGGDIPLRYGVEYFGLFTGAASLGGWIICGGLSIMLLAIVLMSVIRTTDSEYFLGYGEGLTFFLVGCFTYLQLFSIRPLWVWNWIDEPEMVRSPLFLSLFVSFFAVSFLLALTVLSVNLFCRDTRRIAHRIDEDSYQAEEPGKKRILSVRKVVFLSVCIVFALGALPGRVQFRTNRMLAIMNAFVRETVREAGDAQWLFTDGSYDAGIELVGAAQGKSLVCVPVFHGLTSRPLSTIVLAMQDDEDRLSAQVGGANILSAWQRDKPERMAKSAVQIGFELWRRSGSMYPTTSGVLARPGMDGELCATGVTVSHALINNILDLYAAGGPSKYAGRFVNDLFLVMQWRLSRLARIRAEIDDHAGKENLALTESELAGKLDDNNESLQRLIENVANANRLMMRQMTPREGLQFALVRADFRLARRYAEPILKADPDNSSANFAMGMSYFEEGQYSRAEEFLARCLRRNPNEPAVWNNLAVVKMRTGRFDEALKDAQKALEIIPDSIEVKDTIREIEQAAKAAREESANPQKPVRGIRK